MWAVIISLYLILLKAHSLKKKKKKKKKKQGYKCREGV